MTWIILHLLVESLQGRTYMQASSTYRYLLRTYLSGRARTNSMLFLSLSPLFIPHFNLTRMRSSHTISVEA